MSVMIHASGLFIQETCEIFKAQSKIMNMKIVRGGAVGHAHKYSYLEGELQQKSVILLYMTIRSELNPVNWGDT